MSSDVGARILVVRRLNGWSQRQLARRAGVPHSAISMIEQGQISPSINSLQKVLNGVPMTLAEFFSLDLDVQIRVFFKRDQISRTEKNGIARAFLAGRGGDNAVVVVHEHYPPGADTGEEPLVADGEMIGFVISGAVEMTVGGDVEVQQAGDGFYFERSRPHRFRNPGRESADLFCARLPPRSSLR